MARKPEKPVEETPKAGGSYVRHPETGELNRVEGTAGTDEPAAVNPEAAPSTQPE